MLLLRYLQVVYAGPHKKDRSVSIWIGNAFDAASHGVASRNHRLISVTDNQRLIGPNRLGIGQLSMLNLGHSRFDEGDFAERKAQTGFRLPWQLSIW